VELIVRDRDLLTWLTGEDAVRWAGEAVDAHHRGELVAPARVHADFGDGRLVFTAGHLRGSWFGYRSYDTFPADPGAQVVVVHDEASGQVQAELGPKQQGGAEFGLDLPGAAALLVTDSLDQIGAYRPPNVLVGTPHRQRLASLGAVRAGEVPPPGPGQISLFFSVGLAGTEAFLLNRLAAHIEARRG